MNKVLTVLLLFLLSLSMRAQEDNDWKLFKPQQEKSDSIRLTRNQKINLQESDVQGVVKVYSDPRIDQLTGHIGTPQNGKPTVTMKGYRIQAFFDQDKVIVNQKRAEYISSFREQPAYIDYLAPNFRLRIGDFRTKLDAIAYQEKIKSLFPDAVIVMDDIELPPLGE